MDTPTIASYYRESDPVKRNRLLAQAEESGEDPQGNAVRREIWEMRYQRVKELGKERYADSFLHFWMTLQFNRDADKRLFGMKNAHKEVQKHLNKLKFEEMRNKSPLHEELLYRECCHLVDLYIKLCREDKAYQNMLFGVMSMSKDRVEAKLRADVYETGIRLPEKIGMEKELDLIVRAARDMFRLHFPDEDSLSLT